MGMRFLIPLFVSIFSSSLLMAEIQPAFEVTANEVCRTVEDDRVCLPKASDVLLSFPEGLGGVYTPTPLGSLHVMEGLRNYQNTQQSTNEPNGDSDENGYSFFLDEELLTDIDAKKDAPSLALVYSIMGARHFSMQDQNRLLDSNLNRLEIRDIAFPTDVLRIMGIMDIDGLPTEMIDGVQLPKLEGVSIANGAIEFPIYFKVFWDSKIGIGGPFSSYVAATVRLISSPNAILGGMSLPELEFWEKSGIEQFSRAVFVESIAVEGDSADQKTQTFLQDVIGPYVVRTVFWTQIEAYLIGQQLKDLPTQIQE